MTERKKIGLALSGGASRGFAHLGVLKALVENAVPIDYIAGTSAGALAAGLFASTLSIEKCFEVARKVTWLSMGYPSFSRQGIFTNAPMGDFIRANFPVARIEDLKIPCAFVSTDLETGDEVIFRETGDLAFAIRASCAIPGVFLPLENEAGRKLVDGGVIAALPVRAARALGAEIVIAVDLNYEAIQYSSNPRTLLGVMFQSAMLMLKNSSQHQYNDADVIVAPAVGNMRFDDLKRLDELLALGERAANEKLDEIRALVFSSADV
jgi:NTE family protein